MDKESRAAGAASTSRRHFLRLLSGVAVGAAGGASLALTGCGGGKGGSNGGGNNGGGNGTEIPPDVRMVTIQAAQDFINSVSGEPRATRRTRVAEFLRTRTEFIGSGVNEDGVWAIFSDGVPYMFLDNRRADPPNARAVNGLPPSRGADVPGSRVARVVNAMGSAFTDETPLVRSFLQNNADVNGGGTNYQVVVSPGSVESLRLLDGDGLFYMNAHGGKCTIPLLDAAGRPLLNSANEPRTLSSYGIWTSTVADPASMVIYRDDLRRADIGIGSALVSVDAAGNNVSETRFWITARFISRYVRFGKNSLVWFSACESNSAVSQDFRQACLDKGAGIYVGWTSWTTSEGCIAAGKFVLDRLSGSNAQNPVEDPAQRPFDYASVWNDLRKRGLHRHSDGDTGTTELVYTVNPAQTSGMVNPAIKYVLVDEAKEEAILRGQFGEPEESERQVLIGGVPAAVREWTEDRIYVRLPQTGDGSQGDVQVVVREHKSNIRRITAWDLTVRYKYAVATTVFKVTGTIRLRFRADIGTYREKPGEAPKEVLRTAVATKSSAAELTASGTERVGDTTTTWSGEGRFPSFLSLTAGTPPPPTLTSYIAVDTYLRQVHLALELVAAPSPFVMTTVNTSETFTSEVNIPSLYYEPKFEFPFPTADSGGETPLEYPALTLALDEQFGIAAGPYEGPPSSPRLEWDATPAQSPPDPQAARSARP